jgi:hypothetical protein
VEDEQRIGDDLIADVNAHVSELAERLDGTTRSDSLWSFRCECGEPGCRDLVELSVADFQRLRCRGEPVLAPRHEVEPPPAA